MRIPPQKRSAARRSASNERPRRSPDHPLHAGAPAPSVPGLRRGERGAWDLRRLHEGLVNLSKQTSERGERLDGARMGSTPTPSVWPHYSLPGGGSEEPGVCPHHACPRRADAEGLVPGSGDSKARSPERSGASNADTAVGALASKRGSITSTPLVAPSSGDEVGSVTAGRDPR